MTATKHSIGTGSKICTGKVGESGPSALLHHRVTGDKDIVMVVKNNQSNLCPSTGAVALLVVNGVSTAHGIFTEANSSVQAIATPGDNIVAIVHTIPLFNGIECVTLGELEFSLEQCDLE